jgi:translation initiation factor IF-3
VGGEIVGIMRLKVALSITKKIKKGLVEISPDSVPPVCKFESLAKVQHKSREVQEKLKTLQRTIHTKEIKFTLNIGVDDFETKVHRVLEVIRKGDKAKISITFKGREHYFKKHGLKLLMKVQNSVSSEESIEVQSKEEDRCITAIVTQKQTLNPSI